MSTISLTILRNYGIMSERDDCYGRKQACDFFLEITNKNNFIENEKRI